MLTIIGLRNGDSFASPTFTPADAEDVWDALADLSPIQGVWEDERRDRFPEDRFPDPVKAFAGTGVRSGR